MHNREAILYIHGSDKGTRYEALNQLTEDLSKANSFAGITVEDLQNEEDVRLLKVAYHGSEEEKEFYIFEVFWGDLRKPFSEERPVQRFFKSTALIFYWLFSGIWKAIIAAPRMSVPMIGTMLLMIGWYFSLLLIVAEELGDYFGGEGQVIETLDWLTQYNNWAIWGVITFILTFAPMSKIINMAFFTRNYLQDKDLRSQIRGRIVSKVDQVVNDSRFDQVQILAHSFGSIIATEFLSNDQIPFHNKEVKVVTMGSSLSFVAFKAPWFKEMLARAQGNDQINVWCDYFSPKDWLCSLTPKLAEEADFKSTKLNHPVPIEKQLSGESHSMYFFEEEVLAEVLKKA